MKNQKIASVLTVAAGVFAFTGLAFQAEANSYINGGLAFDGEGTPPVSVLNTVPGYTGPNEIISVNPPVLVASGTETGNYAIGVNTANGIEDILGSILSFGTVAPTIVTFPGNINFQIGPSHNYSTAPTLLWSFKDRAGKNYSFDYTTVTASSTIDGTWEIGGAGIAYEDGYLPTAGTWNITIAASGGSWAFGSTANGSGAPVPDGGMTVAFLGGSLLVVGGLRRKLSR